MRLKYGINTLLDGENCARIASRLSGCCLLLRFAEIGQTLGSAVLKDKNELFASINMSKPGFRVNSFIKTACCKVQNQVPRSVIPAGNNPSQKEQVT
jgi:hypothetical protein